MFYGSPSDSKFTDQPVPVVTAKINGEDEQLPLINGGSAPVEERYSYYVG